MSKIEDIKMADVFQLPLKYDTETVEYNDPEYGSTDYDVIRENDSSCEIIPTLGIDKIKAIVYAVNSHDTLTSELEAERKAKDKEISDLVENLKKAIEFADSFKSELEAERKAKEEAIRLLRDMTEWDGILPHSMKRIKDTIHSVSNNKEVK